MENTGISREGINKKFTTTQEDLDFLRGEVARHEKELDGGRTSVIEGEVRRGAEMAPFDEAISRQIREYKKKNTKDILEENYKLSEKQEDEIVFLTIYNFLLKYLSYSFFIFERY